MIEVLLLTTKLLAGTPPKETEVIASRLIPVIVVVVLPSTEPILGVILLISGVVLVYVNPLENVVLPAAVVTTIATTPAACAGVTASISVGEILIISALIPPIVTVASLVKFCPTILIKVWPPVFPVLGATEVICGIPKAAVV